MKLTPFEAAFERVALRILKRHEKALQARLDLAYSRAVAQAVEYLEAKTSPAVKANKTRKQIAAFREACSFSLKMLILIGDKADVNTAADLLAVQNKLAAVLKTVDEDKPQ